MGLFSSAIHLRDVAQLDVMAALDWCLSTCGYTQLAVLRVPPSGPGSLPDHSLWTTTRPYYLVSKAKGRWTTVIEGHFAVREAPWLSELAKQLSRELSTYAIALMVHDDDVLYYNLEHRGESLDGYNSCPQYFEEQRLSEEYIADQRHTPAAFMPILPEGVTVDRLKDILDRGWWSDHDDSALDEHGVQLDRSGRYVSERDRMIDLGRLLELNGPGATYPFTAWAESPGIPWSEYIAVAYTRRH